MKLIQKACPLTEVLQEGARKMLALLPCAFGSKQPCFTEDIADGSYTKFDSNSVSILLVLLKRYLQDRPPCCFAAPDEDENGIQYNKS
mgnify:CR=1 FL=1